MESMSMDENEGQERWQPGGSSRAPSRASEARSGIRQRKILQKSLIGRPKHHTSLLDASKQAQVLVGALEAAQTQQQEIYQMVQEQVQAHLAEELSNWRAEQQIHEGIYLERITNLEQEVSKLRTELTEARCTIQQPGPVRQNTPAIGTQPNRVNKQDNNQTPKVREMSQQSRQEPTFADLAALLSTRPGGQEWQEVTKRKPKNRQIQAVAVASQPDPIKLKPAKNSPKEAQRLLFHCEGGKAAPRSEKEDIILAINRAVAKERFPAFIRVVDAGYTNTGAITILLEKGTLGSMLLPDYKDLLVTAARQADPAVISVELPEQWYRVKVHGVPIRRYLTCGLALAHEEIVPPLAREEIELGTEYQLKRNPTWLRSSKELQNSNQKGSTIVITVGSLEEARRLLINGIRFGGSRYKTEQYWETGVDTVCPRCCQLGHRSFKACGDRPPCCFICAGPHEGTEHVCRVVDCPAKPGTACKHIPAKCGTCGGPHPATVGNCPAKRVARKELRKRTIESKNVSPPAESPQRMTSMELAIPSSPGFNFTVVNRDRYQSRPRSSSAPNSPQTQRYLGPSLTTGQEEDTEMRGVNTPGQSMAH
ncbi:hypothetical protein SI65_08204 [Aspergillus cristatus]|uniref:Gag-like protein n=1 Tax=Aspergillus cristatus TaxID=573508 RepID=A0A1E3B5F8_ASPCR|nr:hypothetical protein SI65_08204 [Aspergillus cristatus]